MADLLPGWPPELGSVGGTRTRCVKCGGVEFLMEGQTEVMCLFCGTLLAVGDIRVDSVLTMFVYESGGSA